MNQNRTFARHSLVHSVALTAMVAGWLAPVRCPAQCRLADVNPYATGNPVQLRTLFPGEYMVPGTNTRFSADNPQSDLSVLLLNFASFSYPLPAPHHGTLVVDPSNAIEYPSGGGSNSGWTISLPNFPSLLGAPVFTQSFHLDASRGQFFASNGLQFHYGFYAAEVEITGVALPSGVIGGVGPRDYRVYYRNNGPAPTNFNVHVTVGPSWGDVIASVNGFDSGSILVPVPTPLANGAPTSSITVPVSASTAFVDCSPSNNQFTTSLSVAVPYWDLHVQLVGVPSPVWVGSGIWINWAVDVTNQGNVWSGNYDLLNQINCAPGQGVYNCTPNLPVPQNGNAPLGNGQTRRHYVQYFVPGNTWRQTQWAKAEITSGDVIGAGNFAEAPIAFW